MGCAAFSPGIAIHFGNGALRNRVKQRGTVISMMEYSAATGCLPETGQRVIVVDDDVMVSATIADVLGQAGFRTEIFASAEAMFAVWPPAEAVCLLLDEALPGMCGVETLCHLRAIGNRVPVVMISGSGDVRTAVAAMKAGASDFIEKPARGTDVLAAIGRARALSDANARRNGVARQAEAFLAGLSRRERQVLDLMMQGCPNKIIAYRLSLSQRTVENYRAKVMHKSATKSFAVLSHLMAACALPVAH